MLVGLSNRGGLQQDPFSGWFNKEYGSYGLNKEAVKGIEKIVKTYLLSYSWVPGAKIADGKYHVFTGY